MHIGPDIGDAKILINAYDENSISVNDKKYFDTLLIMGDKLYPNWFDKKVDELKPEDFSAIIHLTPQLLLIGTGKTQIFPPKEVIYLFNENRIGLEFMATDAACRTFNVLASEGRNVAGVFFI